MKEDRTMLAQEIANGETDVLEFKRDVPSEKLKILKTACAFANGNGGRIVIGVEDNGTVVGVDELNAFRLADQVVDTISNCCVPQVPVTSEIATVNGKTVIVLTVQMGLHCPYFVKSLGKEKGTFVRVGATSRTADEGSLADLAFAGSGSSFDSQPCRGLTVGDRDIARLCARMYRIARENCLTEDDKKTVKKVTAAQFEDWGVLVRSGRKLLPTNAFALLVGARQFHSEVQCGCFRGTTRSVFTDQKTFDGNVIDQMSNAYDFVRSKIGVGMTLKGVYRQDVYEIPLGVIREMIVNAVVHRVYVNPQAMSVQVALYDDRLEVTSPGGLPHGMSLQMLETGHSRARNKALALAFRYMRIVEKWGSGMIRMRELLSEAGLPPLDIQDNGVDFRLTVKRTAKSTVRCGDDTVATNSTVLYHNSTVGSTVGRNDSTLQGDWTKRLPPALQRLVAALSNETLGSQELCRRLNLKSRGALRQTYIQPAIKAGVIDVVGGMTHSSKRAYRVVCPTCKEDGGGGRRGASTLPENKCDKE